MDTPTMLARTAGYWLVGQLLVATVVAAAVPGGASLLVMLGFVTAYYDDNIFAVHVVAVPWTDPTVWFSVQTLVQMVVIAAAASSVVTLYRTNSWQQGVLPDSAAPKRDKPRPEAESPPTPPPPPAAPPPSDATPGQATAAPRRPAGPPK